MTKKVNIPTAAGADIQNVNAALSRRLKALRHENGLTLDELSRRSGVSKGMLVEIEKGEANPSIAILCKTAATFGISVADILNVSANSPVRLVAPEESAVLWKGTHGGTATLLVGTSGPDMLELWRWVMKPGETFESDGHQKGTLELLHVEQGTLTIAVDDAVVEVPAGSSALAQTDAPHSYSNRGNSELHFVMTVSEHHRNR
jgi:transcriptional regulator with XRE-family HTH domain